MAENLTDHGPGWVRIYHPESGPEENSVGTKNEGPPLVEVTIEAWQEVYEPKGWALAEGEESKITPEAKALTATPPKEQLPVRGAPSAPATGGES